MEEVDRYRQDWKPENVRVVLLAESHVHTKDSEYARYLRNEFRHNDGKRCRLVMFVYCLGSTERQVLEMPEALENRRGPSQFWRILYSCQHFINANSDFRRFDGGSDSERLKQKISLLEWLKANGIWLVDASIVGINVLDYEARVEVVKKCWRDSIGPTLKTLKDLKQIIVIGLTVHDALIEELSDLRAKVDIVPQPQARIKGGYVPNYQKIFSLCQ